MLNIISGQSSVCLLRIQDFVRCMGEPD